MTTPSQLRQTHTVVVLGISQAAFDEISQELRAAGYDHVFMPDGEIDMSGIAVAADPAGPPWCCEKGEAQNVPICRECAETSAAYSAAMAPDPTENTDAGVAPSDAPSVMLSAEDAHFLAVRLRRLCAHMNYTLPKFAEDDASLVNIAGTVIGALLTNLAHGVAGVQPQQAVQCAFCERPMIAGSECLTADRAAACEVRTTGVQAGDDRCPSCGIRYGYHLVSCGALAAGVTAAPAPKPVGYVDPQRLRNLRTGKELSITLVAASEADLREGGDVPVHLAAGVALPFSPSADEPSQ